MLKKLSYSVTFPTTGRSLTEDIIFKDGFGAITGPNESGKSVILEMIRFCLFGTAALRGTTDDYKKLTAELKFTLKGEDYTVKRTIASARVYRGEEEIAVGIRPVNEKIVQLFGFGLDVFDMACVANQDELLKLGSIRPAERKRMVDSVIGLGVLDDLAKEAGDEATALNRRAKDLLDVAREPIAPIRPEDYRPSADVAADRDALLVLKSEFDRLQGWLSVSPAEPQMPKTMVALGVDELQVLVNAQDERQAHRRVLQKELDTLPAPSPYTDAQLDEAQGVADEYNRFLQKRRFLSQYEPPKHTLAELAAAESLWRAYKAHQEFEHLTLKLQELMNKGSHTCPKCTHSWPVEVLQVEKVKQDLALAEAQQRHSEKPAISEQEIKADRHRHEVWATVQDQWEAIKDAPDHQPDMVLTHEQIEAHRRANSSSAKRAELLEQLAGFKDGEPDYRKMLSERQLYEHQLEAYHNNRASYEVWLAEKAEKQARSVMLEVELQKLPELNELYESCRIYEQALASYEEAKVSYAEVVATAGALETEADDCKRVKVALTTLRAMVKQHLVPSLNKVASHLITLMTGGQRKKISVDEDFNILVDDQSIDTLSGSGKAVANLALRLGLGQVLTNNVLSLFMGDEIDASMDKDRAENTANTLQTLRRKISQILLVSHKYPAADYYIAVGETREQTAE
jgi:exonuclease SbcC